MTDTLQSIPQHYNSSTSDSFYCEPRTSLEYHILHSAYYQGFHESLLTYTPVDKNQYSFNFNSEKEKQLPEFKHITHIIRDIDTFKDQYPEVYVRLQTLHRQARSATIQAVTDRWIETNPLMYIDFTNSGKSLKEFMKSK